MDLVKDYKMITDVLLFLWIENILTAIEYSKITDRLNEKVLEAKKGE